MLRIRLFRGGRKNQPSYKIVVVDKKRAPKGGRFVDIIGFLNPMTKTKSVDKEKAKKWISVGAQPSDTVHNLLVKEGAIEGKKIDVHKKSKKTEEEIKAEAEKKAAAEAPKETPAEEPKAEEAPKEEVKEETPEPEKKEPARNASEAKPSDAGGEAPAEEEPKPEEEKKPAEGEAKEEK